MLKWPKKKKTRTRWIKCNFSTDSTSYIKSDTFLVGIYTNDPTNKTILITFYSIYMCKIIDLQLNTHHEDKLYPWFFIYGSCEKRKKKKETKRDKREREEIHKFHPFIYFKFLSATIILEWDLRSLLSGSINSSSYKNKSYK